MTSATITPEQTADLAAAMVAFQEAQVTLQQRADEANAAIAPHQDAFDGAKRQYAQSLAQRLVATLPTTTDLPRWVTVTDVDRRSPEPTTVDEITEALLRGRVYARWLGDRDVVRGLWLLHGDGEQPQS